MAYMLLFFGMCTQLAAVGLRFLDPPAKPVVIHTKEEVKQARVAARAAKLAAEEFVMKQAAHDGRSSMDVRHQPPVPLSRWP